MEDQQVALAEVAALLKIGPDELAEQLGINPNELEADAQVCTNEVNTFLAQNMSGGVTSLAALRAGDSAFSSIDEASRILRVSPFTLGKATWLITLRLGHIVRYLTSSVEEEWQKRALKALRESNRFTDVEHLLGLRPHAVTKLCKDRKLTLRFDANLGCSITNESILTFLGSRLRNITPEAWVEEQGQTTAPLVNPSTELRAREDNFFGLGLNALLNRLHKYKLPYLKLDSGGLRLQESAMHLLMQDGGSAMSPDLIASAFNTTLEGVELLVAEINCPWHKGPRQCRRPVCWFNYVQRNSTGQIDGRRWFLRVSNGEQVFDVKSAARHFKEPELLIAFAIGAELVPALALPNELGGYRILENDMAEYLTE